MKRYELECKKLGNLALQQLNLEKNACKEKFEDMSIDDIFKGLLEEVTEVKEEIYDLTSFYGSEFSALKKDIDIEKLKAEIGDVASFCVGVLAWLQRRNEERSDDGA